MKHGSDPGKPIRAVRWVKQAVIVEVAGDVDLNCSNQFQQALLALLDSKPSRMIIHLGAVPYMDSSGVASLVKLLSRARKAGTDLFLIELRERVRSIFEITRLDNVFTIRHTEQEALS